MESILTSIKQMLGIAAEYTHFDLQIIAHINTVFAILTQIGVGPKEGFNISDEYTVWQDYIGDDPRLGLVKSYMGKKVQFLFDPPTNGAVNDSTKRVLDELEWRISVAVDPGDKNHEGVE